MAVTGLELSLLGVLGLFAGVLGALVGIGGGVVIAPVLITLFGFDVRVAVATSLLAVIATSVSAGSVYVESGVANLRIGLSLEVATTVGGIIGGLVATSISPRFLSGLLGVVLGVTVALLLRSRDDHEDTDDHDHDDEMVATQDVGALSGAFRDGHSGQLVRYQARNVPGGSAVALGAGALSGMLGVGGGFLKVPAMNLVMGIPLKVSAATSNFMVGITALASLFIYIASGYFHPYVAAPVALGVMVGARAGTTLQDRWSANRLRWVLSVVLVVIAVQLVLDAFGGGA